MSPMPALGIEFDFDPGPVVANPIRDASGVESLRRPDPAEIAPEVIQALKLTRAALPKETALLGFCGAPWTLAAYLVEGKGAKDFPTLRAFAAAQPALLDKLLARLSSLMAEYLLQQAAAGADAVQIFDSWAGLLSRPSWEKLIRPHLHSLLTTVGKAGVPRILFLQNAPHLMDAYASLPAEVLGVDWRIDLPELARRYPQRAGARQPRAGDPDGRRQTRREPRRASCWRKRRRRATSSTWVTAFCRRPHSRASLRSSTSCIRRNYEQSTRRDRNGRRYATARPRREGPARRPRDRARPAPVHEIHRVRRLRRPAGRRLRARRGRRRRCSVCRRERPARHRPDRRGRGSGLLRDDAARLVQPRPFADFHAQARVRHARPHVLDRLRARSRGHVVHEAAQQDAEPRESLGRAGTRCNARRSFKRCRRIISGESWPSTARSPNATAPAAMLPTCGSRVTASTRTTTTSSSALLGPKLHPLSAVVQEMRKTEQTAQYLDSLGPFFVGKAVWQAKP